MDRVVNADGCMTGKTSVPYKPYFCNPWGSLP